MAFTHHNKESIKRTQESYYEAVQKAIELFGKLGRMGSGYSYFIGENMSAASRKSNIKHANDFHIETKRLFEFGKPEMLSENHHTRSYYFKIRLYWKHPFTVFHHELARVKEDSETGERTTIEEAGLKESDKDLKVLIYDSHISMKQVYEDTKDIYSWIDKCENTEVRKGMREKLEDAKQQIIKWKENIEDQLSKQIV